MHSTPEPLKKRTTPRSTPDPLNESKLPHVPQAEWSPSEQQCLDKYEKELPEKPARLDPPDNYVKFAPKCIAEESPKTQGSKKSRDSSWKRKLKHFFSIGNLEIRCLDFNELPRHRYPGVDWSDLSPAQQSGLIRDALQPKQLLLDPNCDFIKYWDLMILAALCYTAIVTPYDVAFLQTSLNALFVFNRCIDFIFFKDMVMQFFLKVPTQSQAGQVWIRDQKLIARRYLRGWFVIDLMSILPFDSVGLVLQNPAVQKLKLIRIVRLLRLLKILRVLRASRIMKRWENRTSLSYSVQGLIKFTLLLVLITHWMGCLWGLLGFLLATDLTCEDDGGFRIDSSSAGGSWITARDWGPNSPCIHFDAYLASAHFAVMTITSIGYGDICPTRSEELGAGILCQLLGGLTWAYVIGSICGIISSSNPVRIAFEQSMDALNSMLAEQNVTSSLRMQLREYLREQQYHFLLVRSREISSSFSTELQEALIPETLIGKALNKVWYFQDADKAFIVDVTHILECLQHGPRELVGGLGVLCIVQRGSAARNSRIYLPGDFWGADMIVSSAWGADYDQGIALNYIEVLLLRKEALERVLQKYPTMHKTIRKAALSIAFRNVIRKFAKELLQMRMGSRANLSPNGSRIINILESMRNRRAGTDTPLTKLTEMLKENEAGGLSPWSVRAARAHPLLDSTPTNQEVGSHSNTASPMAAEDHPEKILTKIAPALNSRMDDMQNHMALELSALSGRMDLMQHMLTSVCVAMNLQGPDGNSYCSKAGSEGNKVVFPSNAGGQSESSFEAVPELCLPRIPR
eukprot:gnl/MRDRNA2_/MRDRNA2_72521_c0_seq1.p1 gnl/MRDRNA2_/MRDRNA2_72521_c0~~gnl/MRDRNA2_/MRDRNA2_72521_c0_seq1.p1  ORF type:complete len:802 (+),score=97.17 gnl/MRDRNA2_/MRDRNA2_72521_c0_seq1:217-2622(+)